jgi:hypothetical protein
MALASIIVSITSLIIAGISLFISWRKSIKDREYANDKELVEQLKLSLELAYKSLSTNDNGQPINNRLRWLSAARHIARFREIQLSLKTDLYSTICDEHEEFWRDKIYNLLESIEDSGFFKGINARMEEEIIDIRSAAVVYSFSVWKQGRPDPLDNMSLEEIIIKYKLYSPLHRHFWGHVEKEAPALAEKIKGIIS